MHDLIVVGGGAAGLFAAIMAKNSHPNARVLLVEKTAVLLAKVKVSGGGRCNVTHACFNPKQLVAHYPRGGKELLGPFHKFQPRDTIEWFAERGVELKTESDGRMFPITDNSQTIIDCLVHEASKEGVEISMRKKISGVEKTEKGFTLLLEGEEPLTTRALLLATGSGVQGHQWAQLLGHTIETTLPSLFTFNVPTSPLNELSGIAVSDVELHIKGCPFSQRGPMLLTHFGFSGPAVIKLSAWAAPFLSEKEYRAELLINWAPRYNLNQLEQLLLEKKKSLPLAFPSSENLFGFAKQLWKTLLGPLAEKKWGDIADKDLRLLAQKLHADPYQINGKTTHKEEFVTCGGVRLSEVNFQTMQSKLCPGLYFAGEILDIDGVTGGFNFQSAWTTGFLAGSSLSL